MHGTPHHGTTDITAQTSSGGNDEKAQSDIPKYTIIPFSQDFSNSNYKYTVLKIGAPVVNALPNGFTS